MALITEQGNPSNSYTVTATVYDFIPVVKFENPNKQSNVPENSTLVLSNEDANLSKYIEKNIRSFKILELTTSSREFSLPFKVDNGVSNYFYDNDGYVKTRLVKFDVEENANVVIDEEEFFTNNEVTEKKVQDEKNKEIRVIGDKRFLVDVDKKSEFNVDIEINAKKSTEYYLEFYAYDNVGEKDKAGNIDDDILCGRIKVVFKTPNEWQFTEEKIKEIKKYAIANKAKYEASRNYADYHHCTDTHKHIVYKLLNNPLDLGKDQTEARNTPKDYEKAGESTTHGVRNKLIAATYAEPSKTFTVVDIDGNEVLGKNGKAGNTDKELQKFKESPINYIKTKCPDDGYYVFIGAYNDDYHSFTIIVEKKKEEFKFEFIDQLVGVKNYTNVSLENKRLLDDVYEYAYSYPMYLELYQIRNRKK